MTPDEARARLEALGLDAGPATAMFDHFADCGAARQARTRLLAHSLAGEQGFDLQARPVKRTSDAGVDRWDGNGALGYLTLSAICDDVLAEGIDGARLVVASGCFPTGALGYWARRIAAGGLVAVLTATSPGDCRRPPVGRR